MAKERERKRFAVPFATSMTTRTSCCCFGFTSFLPCSSSCCWLPGWRRRVLLPLSASHASAAAAVHLPLDQHQLCAIKCDTIIIITIIFGCWSPSNCDNTVTFSRSFTPSPSHTHIKLLVFSLLLLGHFVVVLLVFRRNNISCNNATGNLVSSSILLPLFLSPL